MSLSASDVKHYLHGNLANIISVAGVLPLALLFLDGGFQYLIALIVYNNVMDDLDGIAAAKLNIRSRFGADLDNVCDAVAHVAITLALGIHFGGLVLLLSALAAGTIILRATSRLNPETPGGGSPTNELMRHIFLVLLLSEVFDFNPVAALSLVLVVNMVSMSLPLKMSAMLRSQAKTATLVVLVNLALIVAWLVPSLTLYIAIPFGLSYLYAFYSGGTAWLKRG